MAYTSGSAASGTRTADSSTGYIRVDWERSSTSGNTSNISWTAYYMGTNKRLKLTQAYFDVYGSPGTTSESRIWIIGYGTGSDRFFYSGTPLASGSFTVTHNSSAQATLYMTVHASIYEWTTDLPGGTAGWELPVLYTNCTAPTNVSINVSGRIVPQTITVSWNGQQGGTNNPISYYIVNANGSYYTSTSSTSITYNASSRGSYTPVFTVKSIGSASGYDSGWSSGSGQAYINPLPYAPTGASSVTITSNASSGYAYITKGSHPGGYGTSLRYLVNGGWQDCTNFTFSCNTSSSTTYYFKTYDGLEYSEGTHTLTFNHQAKPTISSLSETPTTYTALGDSQTYTQSIRTQFNTNYSGTLTIYAIPAGNSNFGNILLYSGSNSTSVDKSFNLDSYFGSIFNGSEIQYKLRYQFTGGYVSESSNVVTSSTTYKIARSLYSNELTFTNVSSDDPPIPPATDSGYERVCDKYIKFTFPQDGSATSTTASLKYTSNGNLVSLSSNQVTSGSAILQIADGQIYDTDLTFILTQKCDNVVKTTTRSIRRIPKPNLNNLINIGGTSPATNLINFKPFTDAILTTTCSLAWPFIGATASYSEAANKYYFENTAATYQFHINAPSGSGGYDVEGMTVNTDIVEYLSFDLPFANLYPFSSHPFFESPNEFVGSINTTASFTLVNKFGTTFSSTTIPVRFDFNEEPRIDFTETVTDLQYAFSENGIYINVVKYPNDEYTRLREGLWLSMKAKYKYYTKKDIKVIIELSRDGGNTWEIFQQDTITISQSATNRNALDIVTPNPIKRRIDSILDSTNARLIRFRTENYSYFSNNVAVGVYAQYTPLISLTNCTINELGAGDQYYKFDITLNKQNLGGDGSLSFTLLEGENEILSTQPSISPQTGTQFFDNILSTISSDSIWSVKTFSLKIKQTVVEYTPCSAGFPTDTYFTFNNVNVYNIQPTIAYRNNRLGINTSAPASDCILDINSNSAIVNKVQITDGSDNGHDLVYDLSDGSFKLDEYKQNIVTVTQTQYDALPSDKLTNNTNYMISNTRNTIGKIIRNNLIYGNAQPDNLGYTTIAPTSRNLDGLKIALLDEEPINKFYGWIYMIKAFNPQELCFTANSNFTTIQLEVEGTPTLNQNFKYSLNGKTWFDFIPGSTLIMIDSGQKAYIKGNNLSGLSENADTYYHFVLSGSNIEVSGNIMSLVYDMDGEYDNLIIPNNYCFYKLFSGCSTIKSAPILQATEMKNYCYASMFLGCTNLTTAPTLPATILAPHCYDSMFQGCITLNSAPVLPATTLADYCYCNMFSTCLALTVPPSLPATVLAKGCYESMFYRNQSLQKVPKLPANNLVLDCYVGMFTDCTQLQFEDYDEGYGLVPFRIPTTGICDGDYTMRGMFSGCRSVPAQVSPNFNGISKTYYTQNYPV